MQQSRISSGIESLLNIAIGVVAILIAGRWGACWSETCAMAPWIANIERGTPMGQDYGISIQDVFDTAAKKSAVDGWQGYSWERVNGGHLVIGEVPEGLHCQRVLVSDDELQRAAEAYEAEEGKCWDCKGTGQTGAGWSAEAGPRYIQCSRCGGELTCRG